MARQTIRTDEVRAKFMAALSEGMSIANAAGAAGARRSAMYLWRKEDPLFAQDWDEAVEVGTDKLEDEARRRDEWLRSSFDVYFESSSSSPIQGPGCS